eukprot:2284865-Alexandrium_andersonii.AAC.1
MPLRGSGSLPQSAPPALRAGGATAPRVRGRPRQMEWSPHETAPNGVSPQETAPNTSSLARKCSRLFR